MKVIVDRKEKEMLVLSLPDGKCINVSEKICPEAKEGDIINIEIFADETKQRKMSLEEKLKKLKKRNI